MNRDERLKKLQPLLAEIIQILGDDPNREGLHRTPERWADALLTYTQGIREDPQEHLKVIFQLDEDDYPQAPTT